MAAVLTYEIVVRDGTTPAPKRVPVKFDLDVCHEVRVRLSGEWAGSVRFEASGDGVEFCPTSVDTESGEHVERTFKNGTYRYRVTGCHVFRARFCRESGTLQVAVADQHGKGHEMAFDTTSDFDVVFDV